MHWVIGLLFLKKSMRGWQAKAFTVNNILKGNNYEQNESE
jgi:hypothetical protein